MADQCDGALGLTRAAWPSLQSSGHGRIQVLVSMSGKRQGSNGRLSGEQVRPDGVVSVGVKALNTALGDGDLPELGEHRYGPVGALRTG